MTGWESLICNFCLSLSARENVYPSQKYTLRVVGTLSNQETTTNSSTHTVLTLCACEWQEVLAINDTFEATKSAVIQDLDGKYPSNHWVYFHPFFFPW